MFSAVLLASSALLLYLVARSERRSGAVLGVSWEVTRGEEGYTARVWNDQVKGSAPLGGIYLEAGIETIEKAELIAVAQATRAAATGQT